jgi:hypothetical protein
VTGLFCFRREMARRNGRVWKPYLLAEAWGPVTLGGALAVPPDACARGRAWWECRVGSRAAAATPFTAAGLGLVAAWRNSGDSVKAEDAALACLCAAGTRNGSLAWWVCQVFMVW